MHRVCKNRLEPKTALGSPLAISVELVHYVKNMMKPILTACFCIDLPAVAVLAIEPGWEVR